MEIAMPKTSPFGSNIVKITAGIAALAVLIGNLETIHTAWCKYIGTGCQYDVTSEHVTFRSGGGNADLCGTSATPVCVHKSVPSRTLVEGSVHFAVSSRSKGVFIDGTPVNKDPVGTSNIGWFIEPKNATADQVCATVYARTSACETTVFIEGNLVGKERNKSWW
jgi:hypothetical protein